MSLSRFLALTAASATSLGQQSFTSALYLRQDTHTMRTEKDALHRILRRKSYTNMLNVTCWGRLGFVFVEKHGAQRRAAAAAAAARLIDDDDDGDSDAAMTGKRPLYKTSKCIVTVNLCTVPSEDFKIQSSRSF